VTLAEAVPIWARIAALSFGGPAGQIAVMHRISRGSCAMLRRSLDACGRGHGQAFPLVRSPTQS
jgi:hypothetical protein